MRLVRAAFAALVVCAMPCAAGAQSNTTPQKTTAAVTAGSDAQRPSPTVAPAPAKTAQKAATKTHRWLDLQIGQVDARYRLIDDSDGVRTSNVLQHKQAIRAGLKFDAKGRYSVQTGLGTGSSFTASWEGTGVGTGDPTWAFNVRTLYVAAQPVEGIDIHVGGLAATNRGEATEITTYDNDGFLVGERVSVKRAKDLWLDEVSATVGYLGDTSTANVFKRLDSLDDHNYTQILAAKKLGARAAVSADWSRAVGVDTWRQAIRVATKETGVVDGVRLELYQRVDAIEGEGFAVSLDKALSKQLSLTGGYASIDRAALPLNGDRYARGRRLFVESRMNLTPEFSVSAFYTRAINNDFPVPNKTRFDFVASYNVLKALQRAGAW